jgi:hypothetical protein
VALDAYGQDNTPFNPNCTLPFENIKVTKRAVDKYCGMSGSASASSPNGQQNVKKNNFCVTGTPIQISFDDLDRLQQIARDSSNHINYGSKGLPDDRSILGKLLPVNGKKIGEGTLVTLEGFILESHYADTLLDGFGGENVNCNVSDLDVNDIHIALVQPSNVSDECESVTAEISPHFRPVSWSRFITRQDKFNLGHGLPIKGAKVRITGQLFFDASHAPCHDPLGKGSDPRRKSIWEIHPVYAVDVFDTSKNKWVSLDQWAQGK